MSGAVGDRVTAGRRLVAQLGTVGRGDGTLVGGKAANLGELVRAGLPVPSGFVVTTRAYDLVVASAELSGRIEAVSSADDSVSRAIASAARSVEEAFAATALPPEVVDALLAAYHQLGSGPVAVRSSATAEDLPGAAFAGQQETYLNIVGDAALLEAVRRCWASLWSERAILYRARRQVGQGGAKIAVVVQEMVQAEVAGVLFTAHPVTGDRDAIVIDASPGLGEAVVGGLVTPDHFVVDKRSLEIRERLMGRREAVVRPRVGGGTEVVRPEEPDSATDPCLADSDVIQLARLGLTVEQHFGVPQDVEWTLAGGERYLLQARPMTALPEPVTWDPPTPGYWMRNLRLGEWLPEPMTPLFQNWLLERLEEGYLLGMRQDVGAALPFPHAAINGWYYLAAPHVSPGEIFRAAIESRGRVFPFFLNALIRVSSSPEVADHKVLRALAERWREDLLPRYRRQVEEAERRVDEAVPDELIALVDEIGLVAGEYLWSLAVVGGSAWKMEGCLARFIRGQFAAEGMVDVQVLLRSLPGAELDVPAHAVQSADWYWPTAGELGHRADRRDIEGASGRRERLEMERQAAETAIRGALGAKSSPLARFDTLLEVAQRYAALREAQARDLTLGWPLLRRCARRLGDLLVSRGVLDRVEDVFFLTRAELGSTADLHELVRGRRVEWERQRRLVAPLAIGRAPWLLQRSLSGVVETVRAPRRASRGAIVGQPASPGRATGPVRIVHGLEEFDHFQSGEILVARATTPAWTPLLARAAAVVTDGGTLAAHASLVAREYGIPAVVATGDATCRLRTGQLVTVDGSAGVVEELAS